MPNYIPDEDINSIVEMHLYDTNYHETDEAVKRFCDCFVSDSSKSFRENVLSTLKNIFDVRPFKDGNFRIVYMIAQAYLFVSNDDGIATAWATASNGDEFISKFLTYTEPIDTFIQFDGHCYAPAEGYLALAGVYGSTEAIAVDRGIVALIDFQPEVVAYLAASAVVGNDPAKIQKLSDDAEAGFDFSNIPAYAVNLITWQPVEGIEPFNITTPHDGLFALCEYIKNTYMKGN